MVGSSLGPGHALTRSRDEIPGTRTVLTEQILVARKLFGRCGVETVPPVARATLNPKTSSRPVARTIIGAIISAFDVPRGTITTSPTAI